LLGSWRLQQWTGPRLRHRNGEMQAFFRRRWLVLASAEWEPLELKFYSRYSKFMLCHGSSIQLRGVLHSLGRTWFCLQVCQHHGSCACTQCVTPQCYQGRAARMSVINLYFAGEALISRWTKCERATPPGARWRMLSGSRIRRMLHVQQRVPCAQISRAPGGASKPLGIACRGVAAKTSSAALSDTIAWKEK